MKHIVSFSGGKDSTAMLFKMIELEMPIDEIIYADVVGAEFDEMYEHIEKVKSMIGDIKFTTIRSKDTYEELMKRYRGWSGHISRWCTKALKVQPINKYLKKYKKEYKVIEYVGIAYDEPKRIREYKGKHMKYPLYDLKITEKEALKYCYDLGFDWSGLYESFDRLSCFLCPLQRIGELRTLYNLYPEYWEEMLRLDKFSERSFRSDYSLEQLKKRFESENRRLKLW